MSKGLCLDCGAPHDTTTGTCDCGGTIADRETLADLAHRLWMHWSNYLALEEQISQERLTRWEDLWVDYAELSEPEKDKDRDLVEEKLREKRHPENKWD